MALLYEDAYIITFADNTEMVVQREAYVLPFNYVKHIVKDDDTLFYLARHYYQDTKQWWRIAEVNFDINPLVLVTGDELMIPSDG